MKTLYFDYAATTPVHPDAVAEMAGYLSCDGYFGNPASSHRHGVEARQAVEEHRRNVADLIGASPEEIVWTSGATESDNLAIKGAAYAYADRGRHIVTVATEHKAVLDTCRQLELVGFEVTVLNPRSSGLVDIEDLTAVFRPDTILASVMHVNNEIGAIQDIDKIGRITRERGIIFHVDAAQSAGKIPIDVKAMCVDVMSLSAHKVYGPMGIGALFVSRRPRVRLQAQMHGGGHERNMRSGTLPTHQIVGMGEAFRLAAAEMQGNIRRLERFRARLVRRLKPMAGVHFNGDLSSSYPGIINVCFEGLDGKKLIKSMPHVSISSGSACNSASVEPSHVLKAIGLDDEAASNSLRVSFGRFTTDREVDELAEAICSGVENQRERKFGSRFDEHGMYLSASLFEPTATSIKPA